MSTFNGQVSEFPSIRIDNFRRSNGSKSLPPLAGFLSHVHTDHTVGLESFKSCFIYCSPATKGILLRLEKYPHRMNFARGMLESRVQHFRHLKKLLRAVPLETPTEIELEPGNTIRVTLFDANHCIGAVMFLIEGAGKAILYTGDIRSEAWWVNSLTRHPSLVPYVASFNRRPIKRLDRIYLDTTFVATGKEERYREFPSKAEGLAELIEKVSPYPSDTVFYVDAWTFGYEEVWQTLAAFLRSRVHLDAYRYGLYTSLASATQPQAAEVPRMLGYVLGNHLITGFLSAQQTRLHSCEEGAGCGVFEKDFVRITPIISRYEGSDMVEAGAGGGRGDLDQRHELDTGDESHALQLLKFCMLELRDQPGLIKDVEKLLNQATQQGGQAISLDTALFATKPEPAPGEEIPESLAELPLGRLVPALTGLIGEQKLRASAAPSTTPSKRKDGLPDCISFPYSRHSSYSELCLLVQAFQPLDIFPCTVVGKGWDDAFSMRSLFGHLFEREVSFFHDELMSRQHSSRQRYGCGSFALEIPFSDGIAPPANEKRKRPADCNASPNHDFPVAPKAFSTRPEIPKDVRSRQGGNRAGSCTHILPQHHKDAYKVRREAYDKAVQGEWAGLQLSSTSGFQIEKDL